MRLAFWTAMCLLAAMPCRAGEINAALGRPYTLEPAPNYDACTGASDARDLADGAHAPDATYPIWIQQATVGWQRPAGPVKITFDLGRATPIDRVLFHTAGGASDVLWPRILDVEVSLDGAAFYTLGSLADNNVNRADTAGIIGYRRATLDAAFPAALTRYVRLRARANGLYLFVDEIEIHRAAGPAAAADTFPPAVDDAAFMEDSGLRALRSAIRRRLELDLDRVAERIGQARAADGAALDAELERLKAEVAAYVFAGDVAGFRAVAPQNPLHAEIFALHGKLLAAEGFAPLTLWTGDRFDTLTPLDLPEQRTDDAPELFLAMLNGEKRGLVLNLTNATGVAAAADCEVVDLSADLLDALFVDGPDFDQAARALVPLDGALALPAGMTRQLYLRFRPDNLAPGEHIGTLSLAVGGTTREIPLRLAIGRTRLPDAPTLEVGLWDYLDFGAREQSWSLRRAWLPELIALEKDLGVGVTFAEWGLGGVNRPELLRLAADGKLAAPLDFSAFDAWTEQWPDARRYVVYMCIGLDTQFGDAAPGSARFNAAIADWAGQWDAHLERRGLAPGRVVLQVLDEPRDQATYQRTRAWLEPIRRASKRLWLYSNPLKTAAAHADDLAAAHILSPIRDLAVVAGADELALYQSRRAPDGAFWLYNCVCGPFNAAPWHFRGQAWDCFRLGATGSFFWSLGDAPGDAWNRYADTRIYFAPFLVDDAGLTATKHTEALREGARDYDYLVLLRAAVEAAKAAGGGDAALADAEAVLRDAARPLAGPAAHRDVEALRLRAWRALEALE